ncbi:MAG: 50S ribosomal protein P1 [Candidatus Bathyarchaeia archaeon]
MSSPYVHAALLLHFGKQPVNEENVKKVLTAAGMTVDDARVKALTAAISEVNIDEAVKTAPVGFAAAPAAVPSASEPAAAPKEKEKKKGEEKKEEEALAGLGSLFG